MNSKAQNEASEIDDVLGVKCSFETKCNWEWNETIVDGFQVVTGANLTDTNRTGIMPGPPADALNDASGKKFITVSEILSTLKNMLEFRKINIVKVYRIEKIYFFVKKLNS